VSGTTKYDRSLRQLRHAELHWLDVADRVTFKLSVMVHNCLHNQAPDYLSRLCTPVAHVAKRQHLRSASRRLLVVPRVQLDTYDRRVKLHLTNTLVDMFVVSVRLPVFLLDGV